MSAQSSRDANWSTILDQIQRSLARTLTEVEEREQAFNFAAVVTVPPTEREPLSAQIAGTPAPVPSGVAVAEKEAEAVDERLSMAEKALRAWLERAAAVRSTLAKDADSGV